MASGTVKFFNQSKGFGFITAEDGDYFVHISDLEKSGIASLNEGDKVEFEVTEQDGKKRATNLTKS